MVNKNTQTISPKYVFMAAAIVLAVIAFVFLAVFVIDWRPGPLAVWKLDKNINSQMFDDQVAKAVNKRDLTICEEGFSEELLTLSCLLEATPKAWLTYNDPSLCDNVSQTAFSQPINFAGDFLFDNHGACITFLSLGSGKDFCHKAILPLSQASCQHIVRDS